jgi:multiple sugar transport system substrate-binding protein
MYQKNKWRKNIMKKTVTIITVLLAFVLVFIEYVHVAQGEEITLVTSRWAGPHADYQAQILKEFEKATGIKVKQDAIDYGQLYQKQVLNMSTKTGGYDLVWAQEIWLPNYTKAGYLLPLNDYLAKIDGFDLKAYNQSMIKIDTIDGKLYGLPTYVQTPMLVYNKEMLAQEGLTPPATWKEVLAVAKHFKDKGTGIALPAKQGMAAVDIWAALMRSNGGDYFDANGKLALTQAANVETLEFWKALIDVSMQGSTSWHFDEVNKAIQFGQAPLGITASGLFGFLEDAENSRVAGKVGYAPLPYSKKPYGTLALWSWCVTADSKYPKEATMLAAWLTSKEIEKKQTLANGQISAIVSLFEDKELVAKMPWLPALGKALENSNTQPLSENAPKLTDRIQVLLSSVATGGEEPKAALEKAQKELALLF